MLLGHHFLLMHIVIIPIFSVIFLYIMLKTQYIFVFQHFLNILLIILILQEFHRKIHP